MTGKARAQVEVGSMNVILGAVCGIREHFLDSLLFLSLLGLVISQLSYSSSFLRCFPSFPLSGDGGPMEFVCNSISPDGPISHMIQNVRNSFNLRFPTKFVSALLSLNV